MEPESKQRLRVAVVGAGYVAAYHLAALKRLDFVDIVALADLDTAMANTLAGRFGVPMVGRTLGDLAGARPDAVYVLTPPASHCALALQAPSSGSNGCRARAMPCGACSRMSTPTFT